MKNLQSSSKGLTNCGCNTNAEPGGPVTSCGCNKKAHDLPRKKGWWARYVERLKKHENDVRSCCH